MKERAGNYGYGIKRNRLKNSQRSIWKMRGSQVDKLRKMLGYQSALSYQESKKMEDDGLNKGILGYFGP